MSMGKPNYDSNGDADWERLSSQEHLDRNPGDVQTVVSTLRSSFNQGVPVPIAFRKQQLRMLQKFLAENEENLIDALHRDLNKPRHEAVFTETLLLQNEVQFFLDNLDALTKPQKASSGILAFALNKLYIVTEPLGVVLVIGAWNYPVQLSLMPVIGAIAAGNCVVLKPSEVASASATVLQKLENYLDRRCFRTVVGGADAVTALLKEKFDHIFYTGGTRVGQIIYEQAAKQLTPVTLELGGKSPCFVDADADMHIVANRIIWGKLTNAGQTCVAPDFVLIDARVRDEFINECARTLKEFYGASVKNSPYYARMINDRQFERVKGFIDAANKIDGSSGKVVLGGDTDAGERFIAPTVLVDVPMDAAVLQEEVFGPVLPVLTYTHLDEAIAVSKKLCAKPLAMYAFSKNDKYLKHIENNTTSGGMCLNDTILHLVPDTLPFGGVGSSGFGRYHGPSSLDVFSNKKSIMKTKLSLESLMSMRYPPYTPEKLSRGKSMMRRLPGTEPHNNCVSGMLKSLPIFIAGLLTTLIVQSAAKAFGWYGGSSDTTRHFSGKGSMF